jgi:TolB-like protein
MKKLMFFTLLFFIQVSIYSLNEEAQSFVRRKILILPFQNKNMVAEYDYLSKFLMESIRAKLSESDGYDFSKFDATERELRYNCKYMNYNDVKFAQFLAIQHLSDTVISGQYVVEKGKIIIIINIIDVLQGKLVSSIKSEGEIANFIDLWDQTLTEMSEKIDMKLPHLEQKQYNEMMNRDYKFVLTPVKKAGISLIFAGESILFLGSFLIPSFIYYYEKYNYDLKNLNYHIGYVPFSNMYIAYLAGSIVYVISVVSLITIGITLTLVTIRKKVKLSIGLNDRNAEFNNELCLSLRIRI